VSGLSSHGWPRGAPSALLFDFGGTLDADGLPWKERFFRLYGQQGVAVSSEEFDRAFYAADDALVGSLAPAAALSETAERLSLGVAKGLGISAADLPAEVARRFTEAACDHLARSARILEQLHARYRLAVVSNFYGNLDRICAEAGISPHCAAVVDSHVVGSAKPNPRIFRTALAALGVMPVEALFVGDSLSRDMLGARAVGMRHIRVVCDAEAETCCPEDRTIGSLEQLLEFLP
jgi:HAD superfamily hydrolase (TIGR01509 family)